jgi:hypothetical protein
MVAAHSLLMISLARDIETQLELLVPNAESYHLKD